MLIDSMLAKEERGECVVHAHTRDLSETNGSMRVGTSALNRALLYPDSKLLYPDTKPDSENIYAFAGMVFSLMCVLFPT
jgi:hypothetical protein